MVAGIGIQCSIGSFSVVQKVDGMHPRPAKWPFYLHLSWASDFLLLLVVTTRIKWDNSYQVLAWHLVDSSHISILLVQVIENPTPSGQKNQKIFISFNINIKIIDDSRNGWFRSSILPEKSPCSSQLCHLQQDGLIFKLVLIITVGHHSHSWQTPEEVSYFQSSCFSFLLPYLASHYVSLISVSVHHVAADRGVPLVD